MDDDKIYRRQIFKLNYDSRNDRYGLKEMFYEQKLEFTALLLNLKEVSPYLKYTAFHFYRKVSRTGIFDAKEFYEVVGESMEWIESIPKVLGDHKFKDAKHVAFAINLKNIYENQTREQMTQTLQPDSKDVQICDSLFLPEGFKEIVNVCDGINYRFMDVGRVVGNGDLDFMRMMVKYGVIRRPTFQESSILILEDYIMWLEEKDKWRFLSDEWCHIIDHAKAASHRLFTCDKRRAKESEDKLLRLQTISIAMQIFKRCASESVIVKPDDDIAACIRLYFEAVPDSFVSHLEIHHLLEGLHEMKECSMSRRIESLEKYRNIFPDMCALKPRTLKHLSRCTVRESLCKTGQLPKVIKKLPVPQSIKDYIQIV